jgi:DNA modification methylase
MIQLYKGDCLEAMKSIADKSIDAIITDPPYGTTACKWDSVIPFDLMWEQLNRIIKDNGAIVLFGSEPFSSALRMSNIKNYKYDWIWDKNIPSNPYLAKKQPMRINENISIFYKNQCTYNRQFLDRDKKNQRPNFINHKTTLYKDSVYGDRKNGKSNDYDNTKINPKSIIKFTKHPSSVGLHPTQKPVDLMEYLIKTYTNENETVLDFTMGSGTTGIACINTKRNFIGIEMDDKYFEIAEKRIKEAQINTIDLFNAH